MFSWLRTLSARNCQRLGLARVYSVEIRSTSRQKWGIQGLPRPRSILDDHNLLVDLSEDEDLVNGVRPSTPPRHLRHPPMEPTPPEYKAYRETIRKKFPEGWAPPRKVSREAMEGMRQMHRLEPERFSTAVLAEKFRVSPEAVRRILKSRWEPPREKRLKIAKRERKERAEYLRAKRVREEMEARWVREAKKAGTNDDFSLT